MEDDAYFLTVLRYIHQNPLKAGLTKNIESYRWSSYKEYLTVAKIVKVDFVLAMFNEKQDEAREAFKKFNAEVNSDKCLEINETKKTISDQEIRQLVLDKYSLEIASLSHEPVETQLEILKCLKELGGCSLRQLSRLTGFTVYKISKV